MPTFAAIIPAAGASTRYGSQRNKLLEPLGDVPVIAHTLMAFACRPDVVGTFVPTTLREQIAPHARGWDVTYCAGGASRAESVLSALRAVPAEVEWVAVHDAARPLVSQDLITRVFRAALEHGAAAPAVPVALTVKRAGRTLPSKVIETVPRHNLWAMQTPQIMRRRDLLDAYERCPLPLDQVTDDVQLLELIGKDVWLVPGEERNLKITTPLDLRIAEMLL